MLHPTTHVDPRGRLAELLRVDVLGREVRQVYVVTIEPGASRADHYHLKKTEWVSVLSGRCRIALTDVKTRERRVVELDGARWSVLEVPPGLHHVLTNDAPAECIALIGASELHDPASPDTYRL